MVQHIWHTVSNPRAAGSHTEDKQHFKDLMRRYWQKYCEKSTIHGVRYLYDPSLGYVERLIWTALVIASVVITWTTCALLAERYNANKLQTVVENPQYPVFHVEFPAVAICPINHINWGKYAEAEQLFLPKNADDGLRNVFHTFVERMEGLSFGHFERFLEMEDINLESLEKVDVTKLARFLAPTCMEIFVNGSCQWRRMDFDCCDLFVMEKTEWGFCLVFNSLLSEESLLLQKRETPNYYPKHNSMAGQGSGLNFLLRLDAKMQRNESRTPDSILVVIKKPDQWWDNGYTITPDSESYVIVRPEMTDYDDSTRNMNPEVRNCLFMDEVNYSGFKTLQNLTYRQANCLNVCHEEHLIKYCNCTLPLFFPDNSKVSACKPADFRCLAKNNDIFTYDKRKEEDAFFSSAKPGMTCFCLISCRAMQYYTSLTTLPLMMNLLPNDTITDVFKVDVHYQADVLVRYRTSLEFTSIDLIANFGGIFGLWLGASMVSAVELLYYLTIGFGLYLYNHNYFSVLRGELHARWQRGRQHWRYFIASDHSEKHQPDAQRQRREPVHKAVHSKHRHPHHKRRNAW